MLETLHEIESEGLRLLAEASDADALERWRIEYLGSKGRLKSAAGGLKDVPKEEKPAVGKRLNEVKTAHDAALEQLRVHEKKTDSLVRQLEALTRSLSDNEAEFPLPDLCLLFEVDVETGMARVDTRGAEAQPAFEKREFLDKVAEVFAGIERSYVVRIDASGTPDEVEARVATVVMPRL